MNIKDIVLETIKRTERILPTEAMITRLDDVSADIRIGTSASVIKNVAIRGDSSGLVVGQIVPITWEDRPGSYGQVPVVTLGSNISTQGYQVAPIVPDNSTLQYTSFGLSIKPGGIGFEHLSFTPALEGHVHIGELERAGWQTTETGRLIGQFTTISKEGQIALGQSPTTLYLDGMHEDYRMWIGGDNPYSAVFSIDKDGAINATAGTLGALTVNGVINVGTGGAIQSSNFVSGSAGWKISYTGDAEFSNITARGEIKSAVFVKNFIQALYGSFIIAKSAAVLNVAATVPSSPTPDVTTFNITVKSAAAPFATGEIVRLKNASLSTWGTVGAPTDNLDGTFTYTVTYKSGSSGTYEVGLAVIDYGPTTGSGYLYMTASDTNAPFYSVRTHAGAPWTTESEKIRIGNLAGIGSLTGYGIVIGDYSAGNYLLNDPSGFVFKAGDDSVTIDSTGIKIKNGGGFFTEENSLSFTGTTGSTGTIASIYTTQNTVNGYPNTNLYIELPDITGQMGNIQIEAEVPNELDKTGAVYISAGSFGNFYAGIDIIARKTAAGVLERTIALNAADGIEIYGYSTAPTKTLYDGDIRLYANSTDRTLVAVTSNNFTQHTYPLAGSYYEFKNISAPATPDDGYGRLYAYAENGDVTGDTNQTLEFKDDAGAVAHLSVTKMYLRAPQDPYLTDMRVFGQNNFASGIAEFNDSQTTPYSFGASPGGFSLSLGSGSTAGSNSHRHCLAFYQGSSATPSYLQWTSSTAVQEFYYWMALRNYYVASDYLAYSIRAWGVQNPGASDTYFEARWKLSNTGLQVSFWYGQGVTFSLTDGTQTGLWVSDPNSNMFRLIRMGVAPSGSSGIGYFDLWDYDSHLMGNQLAVSVNGWAQSIKTIRLQLGPSTVVGAQIDRIIAGTNPWEGAGLF